MRRLDLVPDCGSCAGVCCVATALPRSDDFAIDKPAGVACPHLTHEHRCAIHDERAARGFSGCAIYDCYGAGQSVTHMFAGAHDAEHRRNEAFLVLRVVHELLFLLTEAVKICPPAREDLVAALGVQIATLDAIASGPVEHLPDVYRHEGAARSLLRRIGQALGGRRPGLLRA